MAEICKYVLVPLDGFEDDVEYDTLAEAKAAWTSDEPYAVMERTYTYDDSSLVYTSTGHCVWPPPIESTCRHCGEDIEKLTDGEPPWVHADSGYSNCGEGWDDFTAAPDDEER